MVICKRLPDNQNRKETDQIQQMFNLDEEQTSSRTLETGTYNSLNHIGSLE